MVFIPALPGVVTQKSLAGLANQNTTPPVLDTETTWLRGVISGTKWSQVFPYQLIIVEPDNAGSYAPKSGLGWTFTLPIPPQNISLSTPFAITTYVTLGGIIEEHNGAPVRMINFSGTTGVFFGKEPADSPRTASLTESIFAGTISTFNNTLTDFSKLFGNDFTVNAYDLQDFDDPSLLQKTTGYFQFRLLQQFFDAYAELKKTFNGRKARLAFAMWKDEAVYLCQPVTFDLTRDPSSPLEYNYNIALKATKRIKLNQTVVAIAQDLTPVTKNPDALSKILNTVEQARLVLQGARNTILAVRGDVDHVLFQPIREVALFCKDALAVPMSLADMADSIIKDAQQTVLLSISTVKDIQNFKQNFKNKFGQVDKDLNDLLDSLGELRAEFKDSRPDIEIRRQALNAQNTHPANNPFQSPGDNFKFFSSINIGQLKLPPVLATKIAKEKDRVASLTRLDFQKRRDAIVQLSVEYANAIGMSSDVYNNTYGISNPSKNNVNIADLNDFLVLDSLNNVIIQLNALAATQNNNDNNTLVDSLSTVAGLARRSGIAFTIPQSKFAVPFIYGYTLEMLSTRYLGTPDRWVEIAALNGLKSPWVDEIGFDLAFYTNGYGNKFSVNSNFDLFINQPVWVSSATKPRELRHIKAIDKIENGFYTITVDGPDDLDKYKVSETAVMHAYLPNTVNSSQTIFIPSPDTVTSSDIKFKDIPGIDYNDKLLAVGGVDLLLNLNNDIVMDLHCNTQWATGLNNITQKLRLALDTPKGKLNRHPNYGLPISVGSSLADVDKNDLLRSLQDLVYGDPTFAGISSISINLRGPSVMLSLDALVNGINQKIPVSAVVSA